MPEKRTFLYQINVTRDCDLRCTHCYISSDKKAMSKQMQGEQFLTVARRIRNFMASPRGRAEYAFADIHVIGGEPSMLGLEFFEAYLPYVKEILADIKQEVRLSIVTNLIRPQALAVARLFDSVTTSYEIDTRFISRKGTPKPALERAWIHNVQTLRDEGKPVTHTMAVNRQATERGAASILDFFYNDCGFKQVHLGFFIPSGDGLVNMPNVFPLFEQTSQFMIEATEWYLARRLEDRDLYINPVESMIESIYDQRPLDDIICPIIPGSIDVDWNGETVTCIEAGGEIGMRSLGNVFETPLEDILVSKTYRRERSRAIVPKPHCVGCDELTVCQSACGILHNFWNGRGECPGFRRFIKYVRAKVENEGVRPKSAIYREAARRERFC